MIPIRPFFGRLQVYFVLFSGSVSAALRNVTVDDAVLTGAVVPQYLPSAPSWNQGNDCSTCFVKPDPSQAYNSTWHDTTFNPNSGITQVVEFTFVGSALYIFFILANAVPNANTLTDVIFYLDEIAVGTFVHVPSTSSDYQYHVPVYVNESLALGEHNVMIEPVNSGNAVLMLFDYLIYTTDTDSAATSGFVAPSASATPSPSGVQGTTSGQNIAAIVGGTVGGVAALAFVTASLLCYRRYQQRKRLNRLLPSQKGVVLGSLDSLDAVTPGPTPFAITPSRTHHIEPHLPEPEPMRLSNRSSVTLWPPSPLTSIDPPSTASSFSNNTALLEQVELLRDEVSRLRRLQRADQKTVALGMKMPP